MVYSERIRLAGLAPIMLLAACANAVSSVGESPTESETGQESGSSQPMNAPPRAGNVPRGSDAVFRATGLRNTETAAEILAYMNSSLLPPALGGHREMATAMALLERHPAEVVATVQEAYTQIPEANYPARSKLVFVMAQMKDVTAIAALETIARSHVPPERWRRASAAHSEGGSQQEELAIRTAAAQAIARSAREGNGAAVESLRTLLGLELPVSLRRSAQRAYSGAASTNHGPDALPRSFPTTSPPADRESRHEAEDDTSSMSAAPEAPVVCDEPRYATYDDLVLVGSAGWNCDQARIDDWWAAYAYSKSFWDAGNWGYQAPCDPQLPLAGAFNANFLLESVPWYASYAETFIDKLEGGKCAKDALASTRFAFPWGYYVKLDILFFYGYDPISRASTLVHEARHVDLHPHSESDDACPRGASCDSYYGDGGANSYQIDFLWSYSVDASQPYATRVQAANRANLIAQTAFACIECSPVIPAP